MAAINTNDYNTEEQPENQERHNKEVLIRNSDMTPE